MPSPLLVTIGEALVAFYSEEHRPLSEARAFDSDVGGAEFNVATSLARLGFTTAWISRLGADGFGERILRVASDSGLDVSAVERDAVRPTGLYIKEPAQTPEGVETRMHYYRRNSAASALDPDLLHRPPAVDLLRHATHIHTSGITAALSPTAAAAITEVRNVVGPHAMISVDLNYRRNLWHDRDTTPLDTLVAHADLLFAGHDEADAHFGHTSPQLLFDAFPRLSTVVVKDGARQVSVHHRDGRETQVPCLSVEIIEPVGAGDAFAAGFLAGIAEGRDDASALRLGHALAALTLIGHGDRPLSVPTSAERETIASASGEWSGWRVHPGEIPWRRE